MRIRSWIGASSNRMRLKWNWWKTRLRDLMTKTCNSRELSMKILKPKLWTGMLTCKAWMNRSKSRLKNSRQLIRVESLFLKHNFKRLKSSSNSSKVKRKKKTGLKRQPNRMQLSMTIQLWKSNWRTLRNRSKIKRQHSKSRLTWCSKACWIDSLHKRRGLTSWSSRQRKQKTAWSRLSNHLGKCAKCLINWLRV